MEHQRFSEVTVVWHIFSRFVSFILFTVNTTKFPLSFPVSEGVSLVVYGRQIYAITYIFFFKCEEQDKNKKINIFIFPAENSCIPYQILCLCHFFSLKIRFYPKTRIHYSSWNISCKHFFSYFFTEVYTHENFYALYGLRKFEDLCVATTLLRPNRH